MRNLFYFVCLSVFCTACGSDENNGTNNVTNNGSNNATNTSNNATNNLSTSSNNGTVTVTNNNTSGSNNNSTGTTGTIGTMGTTGPDDCDVDGFDNPELLFQELQGVDRLGLGRRNPDGTVDFLNIDFYDSTHGAFPGVGTYPLGSSADDLNTASCGTCAIISVDCLGALCEEVFFATEGEITITSYDPATKKTVGTVANLKAQEVTIDANNYRSTPVPDGMTWCIDETDFSN